MPLRANDAHMVSMAYAGNGISHWEYHTEHPIEEVLGTESYFMPSRGKLEAGDKISVVQKQRDAVVAYAEARVTIGNRLAKVIEIMVTLPPLYTKPAEAPKPVAEPRGERYIGSDGRVRKQRGRGDKFEVLEGDAVVAIVPDQQTAEAMAAGALPLPVEKEAA